MIGLVFSAWFCFWIVDKLISFIESFIQKKIIKRSIKSEVKIGSSHTRFYHWFSRGISLMLKTWVGLPAFHVLNLMMSPKVNDIESLNKLLTGYSWQSTALKKLPIASLRNFNELPSNILNIGLLMVSIYLVYTFLYWYLGFDVSRRIRKIGDIIISKYQLKYQDDPNLKQLLNILSISGWSSESCKAAAWFLMMINFRITIRNEAYENLTPAQYSIFKSIKSLAIAGSLTFLHPIVAGLYLSLSIKNLKQMYSMYMTYKKHYTKLPQNILKEVDYI